MIKFNGKDVIPRFNGKNVSRVMFNGKQIYPSNKGIDPATAPNGVYVYSNNGLLYNLDDWNTANNDSAVGVAVIDDNCKFVINKGEEGGRTRTTWSYVLYGTDVNGLTNYSDTSQAVADFNGENNTAIIREAAPDESFGRNAAHYCYRQTISISGRGTVHGYLPAFGELQVAYNNKSAVDNAMSLIGGIAMPTSRLWSSTECDLDRAYYLNWDGYIGRDYKNNPGDYSIAVFPLT